MMFKSFIQRITGQPKRTKSRKPTYRGLRLESLDKRSLLAADIGAIIGTTFIDNNGSGATTVEVSDTRIGGIQVQIFLDNPTTGTVGSFDVGDSLSGTVTSSSTAGPTLGNYRFDDLAPGRYFVQQAATVTPVGLVNPARSTVDILTGSVRVAAIDTFNQTPLALVANTAIAVTSNNAAPDAIGGQRNVLLTRSGGAGNVSLDIVPGATVTDPGLLAIGSSVAPGTALIQYDGDNSSTLDPLGLGSVDLDASDSRSGLIFEIDSAVPTIGGGITVRIYTSATNFSFADVTFPAAADPGPTTVFVPFSSFATDTVGGATGPADFTDVGAIEQTISVVADQDVRVSLVESARPETVTANLRNVQPLTTGNLVFQDNNNDGIFGAGDVGLAGVDVELYALTSLAGVVNPGTQTPVATTTTDVSGGYSFTGVTPGFYAIVIPGREFDPSSVAVGARTLVGFLTSTPTPETAGANANVDNDDDGRAVLGQLYVASGAFELISGQEPTVIIGGNTNNTFDFGFVSNADLQLTKTFVSLGAPLPNGTREAVFRIDVVNNGPVTATGITVVDTLPIGLTFDRLTSTANPAIAPTGVTLGGTVGNLTTFNLTNLGSTAGTSFHIVTILAANVTADLTNSATVDGDQLDLVANNTDDALLDLPQNDLSISKTLETTTGNPIPPAIARTGDTVVYRITVNNDVLNLPAIDDAATGVTVVDTLPVGVTFVSGRIGTGAVGAGITFNSTTREVTANVGNVNRGTPVPILLTVTVNSDAANLITNAATVSNTPDTDTNTANDNASVDSSVSRAVDLTVAKSISTLPGDNSTAIFGAPLTFSITVTNRTTSPGVSRGFTVTDVLPAGLTLVANSFDALTSGVTVASAGQTLTFTGGTLAIGASATFTFDVLVAQNAAASITNTALVAPINSGATVDVDINTANGDQDDDEVIVPIRDIELVVAKSSNFSGTQTPTPGGVTTDTNAATPGGNITYTILVTNSGPSDAVNVNVVDTFPTGFTATSVTIGGTQVIDNDPAAGTLAFVIPSVPVGATGVSVLVTGTIAATRTGTLSNSVTVSGGGVSDLPAGNTASVSTPLTPVVDLTVDKTGPATAIPGGAPIVYTIVVSNTGPSVATNVSFADDLPAGVTIQSVTLNATAIANTGTGGDVAFVIPTIGIGAANQATVVITVGTDAALTGNLLNRATATLGTEIATDDFITTLNPTADVTVTKTVNNLTAAPGGTLQYTVTVSNGGQSTATGVTLVDVLPTGVMFTSGSGPGGTALTAVGQTVNVAVGTLAPAATAVYTINATIGTTIVGALINQATVATMTPEGANALPNVANVQTNVDPGNYSIAGRVFRDQNNNGLFDTNDRGLRDVTLQLRVAGAAPTSAPLQTTMTDAMGNYTFNNLSAGNYTVTQIQPAGFRDGLEQAGVGPMPADTGNSIAVSIPVGSLPATAFSSFNFADIELLSKRRFLASS